MLRSFKKILLLTLVSVASFAHATPPPSLTPEQWEALTPKQMAPNTVYYTDNSASDELTPFSDWAEKSPAEQEILSLYPGYVEPTVKTLVDKVETPVLRELDVYLARAKFVINKAPQSIDLKSLIQVDTIRQFDPEIQHTEIKANQLMSAVAGSAQISNFQWCKPPATDSIDPLYSTALKFINGHYISHPLKETDLSYTNPKDGKWCSDERSVCVESCYMYNPKWIKLVFGGNTIQSRSKSYEPKDYGSAMQSEFRYVTSENEISKTVSVRTLTKLDTPVRGGLVQSMFYFNQVMEYGKIVAVFQDFPGDPTKTVVTTYMAIGIKAATLKKYSSYGLLDVILGRSRMVNSETGITAGLPVFSQNMISSIARVLEK